MSQNSTNGKSKAQLVWEQLQQKEKAAKQKFQDIQQEQAHRQQQHHSAATVAVGPGPAINDHAAVLTPTVRSLQSVERDDELFLRLRGDLELIRSSLSSGLSGEEVAALLPRKRQSIARLRSAFVDQSHTPVSAPEYLRLFHDHALRPLLIALQDTNPQSSSDSIRESILDILNAQISRELVDLRTALPHILPVLEERLSTDRSEEVRLASWKLLRTCASIDISGSSSTGQNASEYVRMVTAGLRDPSPECKRNALQFIAEHSCDWSLSLSLRTLWTVMLQQEQLHVHSHSKIRLAALDAVLAMMRCDRAWSGVDEDWSTILKPALTSYLMSSQRMRPYLVQRFTSFLQDVLSVLHHQDWETLFFPFVLSLRSEFPAEMDALLDLFESRHFEKITDEEVLVDLQQAPSFAGSDVPWQRAPLAHRKMGQRYFRRMFSGLLSDLQDWQEDRRSYGLNLLGESVRLLEGAVVEYVPQLLSAMSRLMHQPSLRQSVAWSTVEQVIAFTCRPNILFTSLVLPRTYSAESGRLDVDFANLLLELLKNGPPVSEEDQKMILVPFIASLPLFEPGSDAHSWLQQLFSSVSVPGSGDLSAEWLALCLQQRVPLTLVFKEVARDLPFPVSHILPDRVHEALATWIESSPSASNIQSQWNSVMYPTLLAVASSHGEQGSQDTYGLRLLREVAVHRSEIVPAVLPKAEPECQRWLALLKEWCRWRGPRSPALDFYRSGFQVLSAVIGTPGSLLQDQWQLWLPWIRSGLEDDDDIVRLASMDALLGVKDVLEDYEFAHQLYPSLLQRLDDALHRMRLHSLMVLGSKSIASVLSSTGLETVAELVLIHLDDDDTAVQQHCLDVLNRIPDEIVRPQVTKMQSRFLHKSLLQKWSQ